MPVMAREPVRGWRDGLNATRRALKRSRIGLVPDPADDDVECPDEVERPDDPPEDGWADRADLR